MSTPYMGLGVPVVGVDTGLTWENTVNANSSILDSHNHSAGSGVPIGVSGLSINADLPFNSNDAVSLRSVRFTAQASPITATSPDLGCIYVSGVDLYYNDLNSNQVKLTSGGLVNATSSGISSGTNSASFVGSTLVVNAASNTPANIKGASILIGQTAVSGSDYITLSPPAAIASNYSIALPLLPLASSFLAIGTTGNMAATVALVGGITGGAGGNIASATITAANIVASTITGTQIATNVALVGSAVTINGQFAAIAAGGASAVLGIVHGTVNTSGTIVTGGGFSCVRNSVGSYTVSGMTFDDIPCAFAQSIDSAATCALSSLTTTGCNLLFSSDTKFSFVAIGSRSA